MLAGEFNCPVAHASLITMCLFKLKMTQHAPIVSNSSNTAHLTLVFAKGIEKYLGKFTIRSVACLCKYPAWLELEGVV